MDLNPVFATAHGATAADVRILLAASPAGEGTASREEILASMNRIFSRAPSR